MPCNWKMDLRSDSKVGQCLGIKLISILTGFIQLVIWGSVLMNFIIQPESMKQTIHNMDTANFIINILLTIIIVVFSVILLYGLFKDREGFINCYLIFNMVMTVIFMLSFVVNLCVQPKKFGVSGFIGTLITIALNILFYFVIRNYYVSFLRKKSNRNPA